MSADNVEQQVQQNRRVRVVVRVRPPTPADGANASCNLLSCEAGKGSVRVVNPTDARAARQYSFDAVLGPEAPQDDVYSSANIDEFVSAAAAGFHATVFAYGQTGSGKTFTMEGFKYVTPGTASSTAVAGSPAGSSVNALRAAPAPRADFEGTPESRLGVVPRAVQRLFQVIAQDTTRRYTIKCSYVQLYKEAAYDLLNPGRLMQGGNAGPAPRRGAAPAPAAALRMRWSKAQEFYLENLFKVECSSAAEVMSAFTSGVSNKVMASHRMNAASSRSHCLFTLHIESCVVASSSETVSSQLTLVDLAGSERQNDTGATSGTLRDESLAINKSLFTLRQVIIALADKSSGSGGSAAADAAGFAGGGAPPSPMGATSGASPASGHVPYRDSKLTCLLKHALGGNSLTVMIACISPCDAAYEENVSTLEYASRAKRVTNQVAVNEDPKSRLIRELRAEVAFLRKQLASLQTLQLLNLQPAAPRGAAASGGSGAGPAAALASPGKQAARGRPQQQHGAAAGGVRAAAGAAAPAAETGGSGGEPGTDGSGSGLLIPEGMSAETLRQQVVAAAQQDLDTLAGRLLNAVALVQQLSSVNAALRQAYDAVGGATEVLRVENETLMVENAGLRDRLSLLESCVGVGERGPGSDGGTSTAPSQQQHLQQYPQPQLSSPARPAAPGQRPGGANQQRQQQQAPPGQGAAAAGGNPLARSVAAAGATGGIGSAASAPPELLAGPGGAATAAAMIELQELRQENAALLQERMAAARGGGRGAGGAPAMAQQAAVRRSQQGPVPRSPQQLPAGPLPLQNLAQPQQQQQQRAGSRMLLKSNSGGSAAAAAAAGTAGGSPMSVAQLRSALSQPGPAAAGGVVGPPARMQQPQQLQRPTAEQQLVAMTATMTSQAPGSATRISTVGSMLPGAAARQAAGEGGAGAADPSALTSALSAPPRTGSGGAVTGAVTGLSPPLGAMPSHGSAPSLQHAASSPSLQQSQQGPLASDDPGARLAQLMSQRNALARGRILGET